MGPVVKPILSPRLAAHLADLARVRREVKRNGEILRAAIDGNDRCTAAVERVIERTGEGTFNGQSNCDIPMTKHRAARRRGRQPKIDTDPELRAFILARMDKLTYAQIEREVEEAFPPERQVKRSAIHTWWQNQI